MNPLLVENCAGVATLTLNRPEKRNALSRELLTRLEKELEKLTADKTLRVAVLAGAGAVFSSGHDLGEMAGLSQAEYRDLFALCMRVMVGLRMLPVPVIARVQGMATAAGCQLACSCDMIVAAEGASFATPGVKIGLFCTTPMVPLYRAVPAKAAFEMLFTGAAISARRAYELGMVNRVVAAEQLDDAVQELIAPILAASPAVVRLGKKAFTDQFMLEEIAAYQHACPVMTNNARHADAQEGMQAFLAKRKPSWSALGEK